MKYLHLSFALYTGIKNMTDMHYPFNPVVT